jgi:hypothetical protein
MRQPPTQAGAGVGALQVGWAKISCGTCGLLAEVGMMGGLHRNHRKLCLDYTFLVIGLRQTKRQQPAQGRASLVNFTVNGAAEQAGRSRPHAQTAMLSTCHCRYIYSSKLTSISFQAAHACNLNLPTTQNLQKWMQYSRGAACHTTQLLRSRSMRQIVVATFQGTTQRPKGPLPPRQTSCNIGPQLPKPWTLQSTVLV